MAQSDITSPTVLLTGPTSGIGARMLQALVAHPSRPDILLLARDGAALDAAVQTVRSRGLAARGIHLDLGDLESVCRALEEIATMQDGGDLGPIDAAMLNAGAQFASRRKTGVQGFELTFTVNVIAQHLLLRGLERSLAPAAHATVMGSSTHRGKKESFNLVPDPQWLDPADLARPDAPAADETRFAQERRRGGVAYASSKLALVTLSHDWAERFAASGRRLNAYDPGLVPGTGLGKDMPASMYWVWKHVMPAMGILPGATTAPITAGHAVRFALGDTFPSLNDGYVEIGRLARAEPVTFAIERRVALWEWLEHAVARFLPEGAQPH
ncbi:SDR family NAD(P)-dependent oxidoreductase [Lacisediminihabitans sp. FW035]